LPAVESFEATVAEEGKLAPRTVAIFLRLLPFPATKNTTPTKQGRSQQGAVSSSAAAGFSEGLLPFLMLKNGWLHDVSRGISKINDAILMRDHMSPIESCFYTCWGASVLERVHRYDGGTNTATRVHTTKVARHGSSRHGSTTKYRIQLWRKELEV
jgi:hypothetical protein